MTEVRLVPSAIRNFSFAPKGKEGCPGIFVLRGAAINYTQLYINKYRAPNDGDEFLTRIIKESSRIAEIVKNLLHYSRQDKGESIEVNFSDVISEALTLFSAQLNKEGITLLLEIDDETPCVMGRFTDLERLLINLVSNARYALNQKYPSVYDVEKVLKISLKNVVAESGLQVRCALRTGGWHIGRATA